MSLPDGQAHILVGAAGDAPDGIVVDAGIIYWTTMGAPVVDPEIPGEAGQDFSRRNGGLHALDMDSGTRWDVVPSGTITTGKQLTSDGAGTLYWADREGHRISRVRTDGSGLTDLVVNSAESGILGECVGVAVDAGRGHLYWTQKGPAKGGQGRILRAGLALPAGETPEGRTDVEVLWNGLPEPIDLHVEEERLYWTDRGAPPSGNTLNRAHVPSLGARGETPEILADGFQEAIGLAVDSEVGLAYVSDLGGNLCAVPLPGGPVAEAIPPRIAALGPLAGLAGLR
ncbi:hypothetical protein [Streptomyces griseoluteus]